MTPEAFERVARLFDEAAAAGPAERARILAGIADAGVRAEVESLLAHDAPETLPRPDVAGEADDPGAESPDAPDALLGRTIARYRVLRLIARGGMGRVYEAEQESPRRTVALKVLRRGLASREALRRFRDEAQALARLNHPGIAQVYEAGTYDDGGEAVPFLAMELVPEGAPITRRAAALPALRDRVALMAEVCDAVHHAHLRGVIHRDLKPENILADASGRPRVIDFGVARLAEDGVTARTQAGELIGTLQYMSPEQCEGDARDVDARADIYALGAILYEVVCGRPAHDVAGLSVAAALRRVREQRPPPPRAVVPRLPRDLQAVVLKAMEPRREDRYQSGADLAADLHRHLAGLPVTARAPGAWARAAAWIGRHPLAATALACAAFAAVTLGGTAAGLYVLALRPDSLSITGSREHVALQSRAGHRLYTWEGGPDGRVVFSDMFPAPEGRGQLIAVGFDHRALGSPLAGQVGLFRASAPRRMLWSTGASPLAPPEDYAARRQATPTLDWGLVADVLPEEPGPEIVVLQSIFPYSASAVRVFDLNGRLRYEVWHDGAFRSALWLADEGVFIVSAMNCERRWDERGETMRGGRYPEAVMALRLRDGHVAPGRWMLWGGQRQDETLLWYRWVGPVECLAPLYDLFARIVPAEAGWDLNRYAFLNIGVRGPSESAHGGAILVLDAGGAVLDRWEDDGYKALLGAGEAPPVAAYRLLEYEELPAAR